MRIALLTAMFVPLAVCAQLRKQPDAAKIRVELRRLNTLGSVLYMAAHPDDENTRAIAYLVNDQMMATAYLSLTRGDGGQNLIGPEIRDQLGVIRTQELLSARRLDGGSQFFTRAIDFGFSKNATETFSIWDKQKILSDVIAVVRQFQPDVILTRFPPDQRAGHGQHTASAILAEEAFDHSNDPNVFPEQLKTYQLWQVKRLYTNTGRWWNEKISEATPGVVAMNVGAYSPLLGESFSELAAESRTQHKSQGFGSAGRRGDAQEFFELVRGDTSHGVFDGINTTWSRVKGGNNVQPLVERALKEYNAEKPSDLVPLLLKIRAEISKLEPGVWRTRKLDEVNVLIQDCLGLYVDVTSDNYWVAPGQSVKTSFEILNRSNVDVSLVQIHSTRVSMDTTFHSALVANIPFTLERNNTLDPVAEYSSPYWLKQPHGLGLFEVADKSLIGTPENQPAVSFDFTFQVAGETLTLKRALAYKWTDPVKGELIRPFEIVPRVMIVLPEKVVLFPDATSKEIHVIVKSGSQGSVRSDVSLKLPAGWESVPAKASVELTRRGEEQKVTFMVTPGKSNITTSIGVVAELGGKTYAQAVQTIQYDHIPTQTLLSKAEIRAVKLDMKKEGQLVAYIAGAGDDIPAALRNMGYKVWEMKDEEITLLNLRQADAVVLGVRAFNTNERLLHVMPEVLEYVKLGGTLVVQYNNNFSLPKDADRIAPYPLSLSSKRVTEENSKVTLLESTHPALNTPNKITEADFDGWVQERGLYFPDKWAPQFDSLLSMHDSSEKPLNGALLVANYGAGHYVYTGLSFFRELPEGVPGAYRLFANLVSMSRTKKPVDASLKSNAR